MSKKLLQASAISIVTFFTVMSGVQQCAAMYSEDSEESNITRLKKLLNKKIPKEEEKKIREETHYDTSLTEYEKKWNSQYQLEKIERKNEEIKEKCISEKIQEARMNSYTVSEFDQMIDLAGKIMDEASMQADLLRRELSEPRPYLSYYQPEKQNELKMLESGSGQEYWKNFIKDMKQKREERLYKDKEPERRKNSERRIREQEKYAKEMAEREETAKKEMQRRLDDKNYLAKTEEKERIEREVAEKERVERERKEKEVHDKLTKQRKEWVLKELNDIPNADQYIDRFGLWDRDKHNYEALITDKDLCHKIRHKWRVQNIRPVVDKHLPGLIPSWAKESSNLDTWGYMQYFVVESSKEAVKANKKAAKEILNKMQKYQRNDILDQKKKLDGGCHIQ